MALDPGSISAAILAAGPDILGLTYPQFAVGVGTGVYTWAIVPANYALAGAVTGTGLTPGLVNGTLNVAPNPGLVVGALQAAGVNGLTSLRVGTAVAVGVATVFTAAAQYTGASPNVTVGVDASAAAVVNPATLIGLLNGTMSAAFGSAGLSLPLVATGLGNGIAAMLATAVGVGVSIDPTGANPPGPPSVGASISTVF